MQQNKTCGGIQPKKNCVIFKEPEKIGGRWIISLKTKTKTKEGALIPFKRKSALEGELKSEENCEKFINETEIVIVNVFYVERRTY